MAESDGISKFIVKKIDGKFKSEFVELGWLGKGGSGKVLKVMKKMDNKEYAVKKIDLNRSMEILNRERSIKDSDHPNIIKYYDLWLENMPNQAKDNWKCLYIQMELCEKDDLEKWLLKNGSTIQNKKRLSIFKQIVSALEYLHKKEFIHRDIKVNNFFSFFPLSPFFFGASFDDLLNIYPSNIENIYIFLNASQFKS